MHWTLLPSPIGELLIAADEHGLCAVSFDGARGERAEEGRVGGRGERAEEGRVGPDDDPVLRAAADELTAYFEGSLTEFTVSLSVRRGSRFERTVWAELARIPYGQTRTYGQIAAAAESALDHPGDPGFGAARAVGVACNHNPLPIVVPCHRVVGAGRKLVGFGGGLERKRFLLELEAKVELARTFS